MVDISSRFGEVPQSPDDAYLPFPAALEMDKVDPTTVELVTLADATASINSGVMPKQGSIFEVGDNHGALDLLAVERVTAKEVVLLPSTKRAVDKETGEFVLPGMVVYSTDQGMLKLTSAVDKAERADWSEHFSRVGRMAICRFGIEAPTYDAVEISPDVIFGRTPIPRSYFFL